MTDSPRYLERLAVEYSREAIYPMTHLLDPSSASQGSQGGLCHLSIQNNPHRKADFNITAFFELYN